MLAPLSPQTTLRAYAFRPYEDRWPATSRVQATRADPLPSLTASARELLGRRPRAARRARLVKPLVQG